MPFTASASYDVTYESLINRFLIPGLGARKLGLLTVSEVQSFLDRLPTICQCCAWGWDDKMLLAFPASHSSGYSYMMLPTLLGPPTLVMESQSGAVVAEAQRW